MKYRIEILYAKDKIYLKRSAVGGYFKTSVLHIGEGRLLEYPLCSKRNYNYHKYPSSAAIEKHIIDPRFHSITKIPIDDLYEKTDVIWKGYIRQQAFEILLNYFNYINKQIQV